MDRKSLGLMVLGGVTLSLAAGAAAGIGAAPPAEVPAQGPRATPIPAAVRPIVMPRSSHAPTPSPAELDEVWESLTRRSLSALASMATPVPPLPSTPTPSRDPTVVAVPSYLHVVLDEQFVDSRPGWPNDPQATAWFADGTYRLSARWPGRFVAVGVPTAEPARDVVVTGTFRKVGGPPGGGYGLIVRDHGPGLRDGIDQGGRYYVLEADDLGEIGIWRRDEDRWMDLLPWTPSEAVRPGGATNELTVQAIGQMLVFLINGVQVASVEDPVPQVGAVGVFVGGDSNEVALERLVVQVPG